MFLPNSEPKESEFFSYSETMKIFFFTHLRIFGGSQSEENGEIVGREVPVKGLSKRQQEVRSGFDLPSVFSAALNAAKRGRRRLEEALLVDGEGVRCHYN